MTNEQTIEQFKSEHEIEVNIVHIGFEKQVQRHRKWLESEVDADETDC